MKYLEEQLEEERDRRLAAEEALFAAQDQIRRWDSLSKHAITVEVWWF